MSTYQKAWKVSGGIIR